MSFRQKVFARALIKEEEKFEQYYKGARKALLKPVKGHVLEIGPGTGANFAYYSKKIIWQGVEPNVHLHEALRKKAKQHKIKIDLRKGFAEDLRHIKSNSVDFVVSTLVLCSVKNLGQVLREIKRVLKRKGTFLFMEHVVDKKHFVRRFVQKMQRFTPWQFFGDGCNPARDISSSIKRAGFSKVQIKEYEQQAPGIIFWVVRPHIKGFAQK